MAHHNFQPGDVVRLRSGSAPIKVTGVGHTTINGKYKTGQPFPFNGRPAHDFVLFETQETLPMLYALKTDPKTLGTKIGQTSKGEFVIELKSPHPPHPGEILFAMPGDLEEVRPHTIKVTGGQDYFAPADLFTVDDVLIINNSIVTVIKVNSKSDGAKDLPAVVRRVMTQTVV